MIFFSYIAGFLFFIAQITTSPGFVRQGHLKIYGYNFAFLASFCGNSTGPVVQYNISYPQEFCCYSLFSYFEDQWWNTWPHPELDCVGKTSVLDRDGSQVLNLTTTDSRAGCRLVSSVNGSMDISCQGLQMYQVQTKDLYTQKCWFLAVSNCNSSFQGLQLDYFLNISEATPNMAPEKLDRRGPLGLVLSSMMITWFSLDV
ncbi:transmembrane protein 145-like [Orbicella faveolata]|uniref:transmembrane protein 145-like n=1 Tax=Orbicella faveolata TaxID=48498 RepID=UPI0009E32745|nr:transmembrane protein 145-like [Orbicella faveolata]